MTSGRRAALTRGSDRHAGYDAGMLFSACTSWPFVRRHGLAALLAVLAGCAAPPPQTSVSTATAIAAPAAMRTEGVPALPPAALAAAERYNRVSGHGFVEWHPTQPAMLVTHREPAGSTAQLWLVRPPPAAPQRLTDGNEPVVSASWDPRHGNAVVYSRGRGGDEAFQLFRLDLGSKAVAQITPDGQRHALQGWVRSRGLALVASLPLDRAAGAGPRPALATTLSLVDPLDPATARVVATLPGGGWSATVSPDDSQLALTQYLSATESEVWLLPLPAAGGTVGTTGAPGMPDLRRLLPAPGDAARGVHMVGGWSNDGRSLFVTSDRHGEFRELLRLDLASGSLVRLSAGIGWDVSFAGVSGDSRAVAAIVHADGRDELRLLDAATGAPLPLPPLPAGSITRAAFQHGSNRLAFVANSARSPGQVHALNAADTAAGAAAWTQPAGTEGLDLQSLPDQRTVRWTSFDGRTISGTLSLPPARFGNKRPVVMVMHGGPEVQAKQGWRGRMNYLVQTLGVAVLEPNVRGSSGYGKTFLALDDGRLREDSVKDMAAAIDWIATQPQLDASRVLVTGGSYGGYMALAAATRLADRIAGAASTVGISNFVSFLENTETYRRDLRRVEYGDERDPAMRSFLHGISPLTHVAQISKPLLVAQGRNDPRVPWTESEQIVRSLQSRGTPVWYLLADNEGHGFARRENADFYFAALIAFVTQTLRP